MKIGSVGDVSTVIFCRPTFIIVFISDIAYTDGDGRGVDSKTTMR